MTKKNRLSIYAISILLILLTLVGSIWLLNAQNKSDVHLNATKVRVDFSRLDLSLGIVGRIVSAQRHSIVAPFDGTIASLSINDGDYVKTGDQLFTLSRSNVDIQLRQAEADLLKAKQNLSELQKWATSSEVVRAQRAVEASSSSLRQMTARLVDTKKLYEKGIVARSEVSDLQGQVDSQNLDLSMAKSDLESVLKKAAGASMDIAVLEYKNTKARLDQLNEAVGKSTVTAPIGGITTFQVISPTVGQPEYLHAGSAVRFGQGLIDISDTSDLLAVAQISERDVNKVTVGASVTVSVGGDDKTVLIGIVKSITGHPTETNTDIPVTFTVTAALPRLQSNDSKTVRVGMSAKMTITTYTNLHAMVVPNDAVISLSGKTGVQYSKTEDEPGSYVPVQILHAVPAGVEVSGLEPGFVSVQPH